MAVSATSYNPDYAVPPGWLLEEHLDADGVSHAEFARRCGRSPKLISEIIAGKAPVEPETALQFEKVLGMAAHIWLGMEADYQLYKAREAEAAEAARQRDWIKAFPLAELVTRGCFHKPASEAEAASLLLAFFRVGTIDAWKNKYAAANVAYRHSPSFESNEACLATWLRLGELSAEKAALPDYNEANFKAAVKDIRALTRSPVETALPTAQRLCGEAGVVLSLVKPLTKVALSGAAWWHTSKRPVLQLSARHKTDDHLWFTFFHEAAHIILHSKKDVFVDGGKNAAEALEDEANAWAANVLVPRAAWSEFVDLRPKSEQAVRAFAAAQGIAPGIVVGMLQHAGVVGWAHMNGLKTRLQWAERSAKA